MMEDKFFRCGWCGFPVDQDGKPLDIPLGQIEDVIQDNTLPEENIHGQCCADEQQLEANRMQVTQEMAIDAGDMSLEGSWI